MNLARFLATRAAATPRAPALLAPEIGFAELEARAAAAAGCLAAEGVGPGDAVALAFPNGPGFVVALHAYKNQNRPHPVMRMIAGKLSDEEIAALAAYFEAAED